MTPGSTQIGERPRPAYRDDAARDEPTTRNANEHLGQRVSVQQNKRTFKHAYKRELKLRRTLEQAASTGSARKQEEAVRRYISSFAAKLIAFKEANRKFPRHRRLSATELIERARTLAPNHRETEPVILKAKRKSYGFRAILDFQINHKARQYLLRAALRPFLPIRANQFAVENGGRNAAITKICAEIEAGARWFMERDIANCFREFGQESTNREAADTLYQWLPISREVALHCLTAASCNIQDHIPANSACVISLRIDSRRGLPLGSASSSLIVEGAVATILEAIEHDLASNWTAIVNYADNFGCVAPARAELMRSMKTLERSFDRCSFGSWRLKPRPRPRRVDHGFDFLGYHIRWRDGTVHVRASDGNLKAFLMRCRKILKKFRTTPDSAEQELLFQLCGWLAAFSQWKHGSATVRRRVREMALQTCPRQLERVRFVLAKIRLPGRYR